MYRRITIAALAAITTLTLAACGGNDETPGSSTTATASESDQENAVTIGQTVRDGH